MDYPDMDNLFGDNEKPFRHLLTPHCWGSFLICCCWHLNQGKATVTPILVENLERVTPVHLLSGVTRVNVYMAIQGLTVSWVSLEVSHTIIIYFSFVNMLWRRVSCKLIKGQLLHTQFVICFFKIKAQWTIALKVVRIEPNIDSHLDT